MKPTEYTFENYVTTPSNRLARLSAEAICELPGENFNPLYIYGPSGVGKTHLLHAIAREFQSMRKVALYVSVNQFTEELIDAIRNGTNVEFREKYQQADILLVDRLEYAAGKESTQEELFNAVEKRLLNNKQVVFAGDDHPMRIPNLNTKLAACLAAGLCVEVTAPCFEEKTEIIAQKLKQNGLDWPIEACRYVALNTSSGVSQVEGEINKILACRELL